MLPGAAALQGDVVTGGVWCWFGAQGSLLEGCASHATLQHIHSDLHWLQCFCFSKASNNSLRMVLNWLTVVHTPWVRHSGEIPTRYSQDVKTTERTLLATSKKVRELLQKV